MIAHNRRGSFADSPDLHEAEPAFHGGLPELSSTIQTAADAQNLVLYNYNAWSIVDQHSETPDTRGLQFGASSGILREAKHSTSYFQRLTLARAP